MEGIADAVISSLRRENSEREIRPKRSRIRFCLDQCTAVTVSCVMLIVVSIYLLAKSDGLVGHLEKILEKILTNITIASS